jgi:hypothetical protein
LTSVTIGGAFIDQRLAAAGHRRNDAAAAAGALIGVNGF